MQWLFGIAHNVAADHFRRRAEHLPLDHIPAPADEDSLASHTQKQAYFRRLVLLFRQLSAKEQALIALKYGAGLTNRAIAELTGVSESNVGTRLHRTVMRLREQ